MAMTKSHANQEVAVNDKLLTLPVNAGRAIVEAGAVIACPLLGTDRFIKFCRERGLSINRERLFRLERLGLFAPVFRVRTPKKDTQPFYIPVRKCVFHAIRPPNPRSSGQLFHDHPATGSRDIRPGSRSGATQVRHF